MVTFREEGHCPLPRVLPWLPQCMVDEWKLLPTKNHHLSYLQTNEVVFSPSADAIQSENLAPGMVPFVLKGLHINTITHYSLASRHNLAMELTCAKRKKRHGSHFYRMSDRYQRTGQLDCSSGVALQSESKCHLLLFRVLTWIRDEWNTRLGVGEVGIDITPILSTQYAAQMMQVKCILSPWLTNLYPTKAKLTVAVHVCHVDVGRVIWWMCWVCLFDLSTLYHSTSNWRD